MSVDGAEAVVSIVTPSLNMGRFVGETIQSVLGQDYPQIEYIVMDGGSKDETANIVHRYANRLHWESKQDAGAADAIRRGFERSTGSILGYLNADDVYLPGAISTAAKAFETHPEVSVVYGDAVWIDEKGAPIRPYPSRDFDPAALARECFICQPAAFIRRSAYEAVGGIDPHLRYTYDYELWLRLAKNWSFLHVPVPLALSRMHGANKTLGSRRRVLRETISTVHSTTGYAGFGHVYAYACHLLDRRDQFFNPLQPSLLKYLLALVLGLSFNRSHCGRFLREYLAAPGQGQIASNEGGISR